jgi:putative autotransporter adhesin-like protein
MKTQLASLRWTALAAALAALGACSVSYGQGRTDTESRNASGFDKVEASAGVNVELKQGPFAIKVEGPEDEIKSIRTEVSGSTLKVYRDGSNWNWFNWSSGRRLVTVTAPTYVALSASSGADIEGDNLSLETIRLESSSGGDIDVSGACKDVTAEAGSGGDVNAEDLKCENGTAEASSGGDVDLYVTGKAEGDASSGGDVHFHGNPTSVTKDESSGGDVDAN